MNELEIFKQLASALAVGLLIGLERGWHHRDRGEGMRVAGLRTYGLIGLLGGIWALIAQQAGIVLLGFGFLGLALVVIAAYYRRLHEFEDIGITSAIASLLTFVLGALCLMGYVTVAASTAVIATLLLSTKPILHRFVRRLERVELYGTLKLLLISVVVLPVLPNRTFDPWQALNPYQIWWMVVLIAAISFVGYFAVKIGGPRQGALVTGLFGGLASSTAVTLHLSRMTREQPANANANAAGILAACATMFPRMLLVASVININLFQTLLIPTLLMGAVAYLFAFFYWRRAKAAPNLQQPSTLRNPFQLGIALKFGLLLVLILLLSKAMVHYFGDYGIYVLAAASGIADVDAITLSVAKMSAEEIAVASASLAIIIAAAVNSMLKSAIAFAVGKIQLGWRVGLALLSAILSSLPFL